MIGFIIRRIGGGSGGGTFSRCLMKKKTLLIATTTTARCNNQFLLLPSSSSSSSNNSNIRCKLYHSINTTTIADRVERVLAAKAKSKLSYDAIAIKLGVTNTYAAQLLLGQAKLTNTRATMLQEVLPGILDDDLQSMQNDYPMRSYNDELLKEPNVFRTYEALMHNAEAIKSIINEQCGDGIMSAIDFYCDVGTTIGKEQGEKRVVITLNGKFLPYKEQLMDDNTAKSPKD